MAETYIDRVIFFVFFSLLVGCICREINKWLSIPYSPLILTLGLIWGLAQDWLGFTGEAADFLEEIEPHAILMIFLPIFAFCSAFETDYHVMKRNIFQVLLLACPGIILVSVFCGIIFKYILMYDITWMEALMIGSVLAETDPVAVSCLLNEIGVSEKISFIVDGESLLNDATAIVFYVVMESFVKETNSGVGDVIGLLAKLTLGSGAIGFTAGVVIYFWLRRLADDPVEATVLTLIGSYLLFVICEGLDLGMSGILSICAMGYFLCGFSEAAISPLVVEPMTEVWDFVGYLAETIIYFLTGIIIGGSVLKDGQITSLDWGLLCANFVLQYLARALMIGFFYPILKHTGYSIDWKSFIVFVHSGLRGTVGLVLALTVWFDTEYRPLVRTITVFHLAGLACFTVIFNGSTAKFLLKALGMGRTTYEQEMAVSHVVKAMVANVDEQVATLAETHNWDHVDWGHVTESTGVRSLPEEVVVKLTHGRKTLKTLRRKGGSMANLLTEYEEVLSAVPDLNRLAEARTRFLNIVKAKYVQAKNEGQCSPETYVYLLHSIGKAIDMTEVKISSWEMVEPGLLNGPVYKFLLRVRNMPWLGRVARRGLYDRVGKAYDTCLAFQNANEAALETMNEFLSGLTASVSDKLIAEIREQITACKDFMDTEIKGAYPHIIKAVQEKHAACYVLNQLREQIEEAEEGGILSEKEAKLISQGVNARLWKLYYDHPVQIMPKLKHMFDIMEVFQGLDEGIQRDILTQSQITLIPKGHTIFRPGDRINQVFVVLHGRIIESNGKGKKYEHEQGSVVGAEYFLAASTITATSAKAATLAYVQTFPAGLFRANLDTFERRLWRAAAPIIIMFSQSKSKDVPALHTHALKKIVASSDVALFSPGDVIDLPHGGITLIPIIDTNEDNHQREEQVAEHQLVMVSLVDPREGGQGEVVEQKTVAIRFRDQIYQKWLDERRDMRKALFAYTVNERPASLLTNRKTSFGDEEVLPIEVPEDI